MELEQILCDGMNQFHIIFKLTKKDCGRWSTGNGSADI